MNHHRNLISVGLSFVFATTSVACGSGTLGDYGPQLTEGRPNDAAVVGGGVPLEDMFFAATGDLLMDSPDPTDDGSVDQRQGDESEQLDICVDSCGQTHGADDRAGYDACVAMCLELFLGGVAKDDGPADSSDTVLQRPALDDPLSDCVEGCDEYGGDPETYDSCVQMCLDLFLSTDPGDQVPTDSFSQR